MLCIKLTLLDLGFCFNLIVPWSLPLEIRKNLTCYFILQYPQLRGFEVLKFLDFFKAVGLLKLC